MVYTPGSDPLGSRSGDPFPGTYRYVLLIWPQLRISAGTGEHGLGVQVTALNQVPTHSGAVVMVQVHVRENPDTPEKK